MKYYAHKVTVKPINRLASIFPIDMLRYDELVPHSQVDANKIHRCCEHGTLEDVTIQLGKRDVKTWQPTTERWESFLWTVVEHTVM